MNEAVIVFVRGIIAFFTLLIFTRALGKLQISQLSFFDYVLGITIGSTASSLTTDLTSRAWAHWVGLFTWSFLVFILQKVTLKWRKASKYIDGEPTVVIMNGAIMENTMCKMRYRLSDLQEQLRVKGIFDLSHVEFAILETNGSLSVLKKADYEPVIAKDLKIGTLYKGLSTELIYDGVILDQNLSQVHLDRQWLMEKLKAMKINHPEEVFLASLDTEGNLYVDTYQEHIKNPTDPSDYHGPN
jgi:uncharacterized membrane protein YcaP (DUF421 family)